MRLFYLLVLMRPANIITAIADIIAGVAISGLFTDSLHLSTQGHFLWQRIVLLVVSTIGLYGGGVVFNDVFDRDEDSRERPERPLPSGKVSLRQAVTLGIALLVMGVAAALAVAPTCGAIALAVALLALTYDKLAKHNGIIGPVVMGLCRSGNLLLGMSVFGTIPWAQWPILLIPLLFIAAITLTSQKETTGKNKGAIGTAMAIDALIFIFLALPVVKHPTETLPALPFLLFWYGMNLRAKFRAITNNQPRLVMNAVKTGVISLIPLNACYVVSFADWRYALGVLLLLPLSLLLARTFSVT